MLLRRALAKIRMASLMLGGRAFILLFLAAQKYGFLSRNHQIVELTFMFTFGLFPDPAPPVENLPLLSPVPNGFPFKMAEKKMVSFFVIICR